MVTNVGNGGSVQMSTTPKGNALRSPIYDRARKVKESDNFFWEYEAYFKSVGIKDEAQKVSITFSSVKDIALFGGIVGVTTSKGDRTPSSLGMDSKKSLRSNSIMRMPRVRD